MHSLTPLSELAWGLSVNQKTVVYDSQAFPATDDQTNVLSPVCSASKYEFYLSHAFSSRILTFEFQARSFTPCLMLSVQDLAMQCGSEDADTVKTNSRKILADRPYIAIIDVDLEGFHVVPPGTGSKHLLG